MYGDMDIRWEYIGSYKVIGWDEELDDVVSVQ
jgi:hypothetical protein